MGSNPNKFGYRAMSASVFISYARSAGKMQVLALAEKPGALAFFKTQDIDDGEHFPQRLLDGVLDAPKSVT
jgi:hypothetical protein